MPGELGVEAFIAKVERMTRTHLHGQFDHVADFAQLFFAKSAAEWFWRYQTRYPNFSWFELAQALREEFQETWPEEAIMAQIRNRVQRAGETFDEFYAAVLKLTDRLPNPFNDRTLLGILKENLRFEVQEAMVFGTRAETIGKLRAKCRDWDRLHPKNRPGRYQGPISPSIKLR